MDCSYCGALYPDHNAGCEAQNNAVPPDALQPQPLSEAERIEVSKGGPAGVGAAPDAGDLVERDHQATIDLLRKALNDTSEAAQSTIAALRQELASVLADWNAIVKASGSPTNGGAVGHVAALQQQVAELEQALGLANAGIELNLERAEAAERENVALRKDAEVGKLVRAKLISGNIIKMERCMILAAEVDAIDASLQGKEE